MDNQHKQIKGYRELTQDEIDEMNNIKSLGPDIEVIVNQLMQMDSTDKRWVAIGRTHLQEGLMSLTRSVAKPDFF